MELGNYISKLFTKSKVQAAEISDWQSALYNDGHMFPYNPDKLVLKKGSLDVYRDMMRLDEQVKACMMTKINMVFASGFKFEPASEEKQDEEIRNFVEYALGDGMIYFQRGKRINAFRKSLKKIFTALPFGFSVTEKVFQKFTEGEYAGKIGINALKTRPPHSFEFEIDKHNNLLFVRQYGHEETIIIGERELPYFIIYSHDADNTSFDSYYGTSDLRAAYRHYWSKEIIIRFRNIYLERFGMGILVGKYPRGMSKSEQSDLKDLVKNVTAKTGFKIPKDIEIDILESKSRGEASYNKTIEHCNKMIARAILVPDMLGFSETNGGSYSLGKNHLDLFLSILQELQTDCEEIVNEQIIKDLVDYNYASVKNYPKFVFNPLTQQDKEKMAEIFLKAVNEGVILATEEDEGYIRECLDFPQRSENSVLLPKKTDPSNSLGETIGVDPNVENIGEPKDVRDIDEEVDIKRKREEEEVKRKNQFKFEPTREKTSYEKKVDFKSIHNKMISRQTDAAINFSDAMRKNIDALTDRIIAKKIVEKRRFDEISKLDFVHMAELKSAFRKMVRSGYTQGRDDSQKLVPKKFANGLNWSLEPKEALAYYSDKKVYLAGAERDFVMNKVKPVLYDGLKNGKSTQEIIFTLEEDLFSQYEIYQSDGTTLKPIQDIPGRIETVVRTNYNEAYNQGSWTTYNDPALAQFLPAFQYSALLDGRTSNICQSLDGMILKKTNPNWKDYVPPKHFNCRSLIVPIFADEFKEETEVPKVKLMPGFGG